MEGVGEIPGGFTAVSTWVYRIAVNTALSFVNKKNKYLNFNTYLDDGKAANLVGVTLK